MNKGELIAGMAEESGVSKADTEKVLNAFLSQVEKALCAGDKQNHPEPGAGRGPHGAGDLDTERQGTDPWLRQL